MREESPQVLVCATRTAVVEKWAREIGRAVRQKELLLVEQGSRRRLKIGRGCR